MMPDKPRILVCPFCGKEKEIMSLASGNTFGAEYWSDNKRIAPMMPEISYVQKCPHCGKYYIIGRQEVKHAESGMSFDTGELDFPETKEAFRQLSEEGFLDGNEEAGVRMMLHRAYNDYYHRSEEKHTVSEEDKVLFRENALWLINNALRDNLIKAEFYREIGEMDTARSLLESVTVENDFLKNIASAIKERIDANDSDVFKLNI